MTDPILIAFIALGLSLVTSLVKLIDWFIHGNPHAVARTVRWTVIGILVLSVPLLFVLMFTEHWTAAMWVLAILILVPALFWRELLRWFMTSRTTLNLPPLEPDADPDLVRRSAAVLEEYLRNTAGSNQRKTRKTRTVPAPDRSANGSKRTNGKARDESGGTDMSDEEALAILGLEHGAQEADINEAHRRLVQKMHPDRGGSHYLTVKMNQAREVLLRRAPKQSKPTPSVTSKRAGRPPQRSS